MNPLSVFVTRSAPSTCALAHLGFPQQVLRNTSTKMLLSALMSVAQAHMTMMLAIQLLEPLPAAVRPQHVCPVGQGTFVVSANRTR